MPDLLVNIDVPDTEQGVAFYTAALGLTVGRRFDNDFVELLGAPVPIYLLRKDAGTCIGPGGGDVGATLATARPSTSTSWCNTFR